MPATRRASAGIGASRAVMMAVVIALSALSALRAIARPKRRFRADVRHVRLEGRAPLVMALVSAARERCDPRAETSHRTEGQ
jgi:hypothetical protein